MPEMWRSLIPMVIVGTVFGTFAFAFNAFLTVRREQSRLKVMTEFHSRLLDKVGSTAEFVQFLQTDGGVKFLDSLAVGRGTGGRPSDRIVRAAQTGIVITMLGLGFLTVGGIVRDIEGSTAASVFGVLLIALGVGYLLSSFAAHRLSKQLGLLDLERSMGSFATGNPTR